MTAALPAPPAEIALLAACATWPRGEVRDRAVHAAAPCADWGAFVETVRRHRMAGLALDGLQAAGVAVPEPVLAAISARARRDTQQMLATVGEARRITGWFAEAGIAATVVKGPPLAILAYGDLALRQCRDLDLLVAPEAVPRAAALLVERGYASCQSVDVSTPERLDAWLRSRKDISVVAPGSGILIELHGRLTENPYLFPGHQIETGVQPVQVGGVRLPALTGDELLLYLCVHGTLHGWMRLKWLADVQALLSGWEADCIADFHRLARTRRLDVPAGVALRLLNHLFDLPLTPELRRALAKDWRVRWLTRFAFDLICDPRELFDRRWRTAQLNLAQLLIRSEPRYWAAEVPRVLVDWPTADRLGGGRKAAAASMVLRPVVWAWGKLSWKRQDRR